MKDVLPKSNVCVRAESVLSNRLQLTLLKALKKVLLPLTNRGLRFVQKKMSCIFDIMTAVAQGINRILEIILELNALLTILIRKNRVLLNSWRNGCLAASNLFHIFALSVKFYTFYHHILKSTDV